MNNDADTSIQPEPDVEALIASIQDMSPSDLRDRYRALFGEETRSGNRRWLIRRIAWREQALREGDLTERARARAQELARDEDLRVRPPTLAEPAAGAGLRTLEGSMPARDARLPIPGTILRRTYKGTEHSVTVLSEGFEHDGTVYRSLTAIANRITGSHWNGMAFFGLAKAKRRPKKTAATAEAGR